MFNPNKSKLVKLDKPLSIGGRRTTRRKNSFIKKNSTNPLGRPLTIIFCLPGNPVAAFVSWRPPHWPYKQYPDEFNIYIPDEMDGKS